MTVTDPSTALAEQLDPPLVFPSTMMHGDLLMSDLFDHGATVNHASKVLTWTGEGYVEATFEEVAGRARRLAGALRALGVGLGDRVATIAWNTQEHLEAYLAVPAMGSVLHPVNLRLPADQLIHVANHGGSTVLLIDHTLAGLVAPAMPALTNLQHVLVLGPREAVGDAIATLTRDGGPSVTSYEDALAAAEPVTGWPAVDERSGGLMCYTSGTTGDPKGVCYSHRSMYLHSLATVGGGAMGISAADRFLVIVPMFHANAWGAPHAVWLSGSDMVLTGRYLQAPFLAAMITATRPTLSAAVPTLFNDLAIYLETNDGDVSSLKRVVCGGAAVPRGLIERWLKLGVEIHQGWGMTETSPLVAVSQQPKEAPEGELVDWLHKTGRIVGGVRVRLGNDDGSVAPWDGESVGELQLRGPWITGEYYLRDTPDTFTTDADGHRWLRTGDVGTIDGQGNIQITDRTKDVIKTGGEWISSVELENAIMDHPAVREAAVIGIPDAKWSERPLAAVVLREGASASPAELVAHLTAKGIAKWWLPESWAFITEVPKTSVGKFDKKVMRKAHADGAYEVVGV